MPWVGKSQGAGMRWPARLDSNLSGAIWTLHGDSYSASCCVIWTPEFVVCFTAGNYAAETVTGTWLQKPKPCCKNQNPRQSDHGFFG